MHLSRIIGFTLFSVSSIALLGCGSGGGGPECTAGETRPGSVACGLNSNGLLTDACVAGDWVASDVCVDPDDCTNGDERPVTSPVACGAVGFQIGTTVDRCEGGQWGEVCTCGTVVHEGDAIIASASDLAALGGVTQLTGKLTIDGAFDGASFAGLEGLGCLGSFEHLSFNGTLTSLAGLEQLRVVEGDLYLVGLSQLTSLAPLRGLTTVGGQLYIGSGSSLEDLSGLEGLRSIGTHLFVENNAALTGIVGLTSLEFTGGGLFIFGNPMLTSVVGLESLTSVGGDVSLENNSLENLSGLDSLETVGGYFTVANNSPLTTLAGIESLMTVGTDLSVIENPQLATVSALASLTSVTGNVTISNNPMLPTCNVEAITGGAGLVIGGSVDTTGNLGATCL